MKRSQLARRVFCVCRYHAPFAETKDSKDLLGFGFAGRLFRRIACPPPLRPAVVVACLPAGLLCVVGGDSDAFCMESASHAGSAEIWMLPRFVGDVREECGDCRGLKRGGVGNDMGGGKGACRFADRVRTDSRCNALVLQMLIAARHPPEKMCRARQNVIIGISRLRSAHCDIGSNYQLVFSARSQHSPPAQLQDRGNTMSIYYPPGRPARYAGKLKQG